MFFYEGLSCPHCHRAFKDSDDIVACPVCGAPHHRDCWNDVGECVYAADHGTENEWSRDKAVNQSAPQDTVDNDKCCPHCGHANPSFAEFCAHCGKEIPSEEWHSQDVPPPPPFHAPYGAPQNNYHEYAPFHVQSPFGGVSPDADIDGETARDVAAVVASNTQYYMPRFEKMSRNKSKVSMNWCALFLTEYWLFHRKQYIMGALVMAFNLMLGVLSTGIAYMYVFLPFESSTGLSSVSYPALAAWITDNPSVQPAVLLLGLVTLTTFAVRLFFGLFGNSVYLQSCLKTIRRAREEYPEGYQAQLPIYGGTSFVLALVMYMAASIFTNFISVMFQTL